MSVKATKCSREQLAQAQEDDDELHSLIDDAVGENEVHKYANCFYGQSGVLMRKWGALDAPANEEWQTSHQIVLLQKFREQVLTLAHASHGWTPGCQQDISQDTDTFLLTKA